MENKVTVLIPAFNEENRIMQTIKSISNSRFIDRIIVIDDGSTDHTYEVVKKHGIEVYKREKNQGKGAALDYGIKMTIDTSSIIVFLDGDIGSTAIEAQKLIMPLLNNEADVAIARFPAAKKKGGIGLVKKLARSGVKILTGKTIHTSLSGQRAFRVEVLKQLGELPKDYGIEVGMIIDILNMGFIVKEVEVEMSHRETGRDFQGFIHRGRQFYQILKVLAKKYKEVKFR
ncbi:MAG: glycosyltransferase family 2 protein [Alkaliphilus sp.]|nr:glycosyltransferase family 2 protein [Alkaliphilus sp.]